MPIIIGGGGVVAGGSGGASGVQKGVNGGVPGLIIGAGIPTTTPPSAGYLYFDTTNKALYCSLVATNSESWNLVDEMLHENYAQFYDEFFTFNNNDVWTMNNTGGGSTTIVTNMSGGQLNLHTGNIANNERGIALNSGNVFTLNAASQRTSIREHPGQNTDTAIVFGMSNNVDPTLSSAGIYALFIEYNTGNAVPQDWYICVNNNGTLTRTDTGIVVDATAVHTWEIVISQDGTTASFYRDDVLAGTQPVPAQPANLIARCRTLTSANKDFFLHSFTVARPL